jgi:hypothetical protein
VSERKGGLLGASLDGFAIIPLGAHQALRRAAVAPLMVKPRTPAALPIAMDDATSGDAGRAPAQAERTDNFGIFTSETLLGIYRQATTGIFAVLVGVVALSLLVGGIVIMNIMLMVVSERTREIGSAQAVGARRKDIMVAGADGIRDAIDGSAVCGHCARLPGCAADRAVTPLPARPGTMVRRPRHRDHGRCWSVLRRVTGIARRATRSHRER